MVDALGNLVRFVLLPSQRHDCLGIDELIEGLDFEALIADKAFDLNRLREELAERESAAVIPPRRNRVEAIACDFDKYRWRHLVENFFCHLKRFRRIATRYDKTDSSYLAMIHVVSSRLALA